MIDSIIKPPGLWLPHANFARANRFSPARCCCGPPPLPGCANAPSTIDQSNIPEFITITLDNAASGYECLNGRTVTLRYEKCMQLNGYRYLWRVILGTCPDGSAYGVYAYASFASGTRTCTAGYCLYKEGQTGCYYGSLYDAASIPWNRTRSVGEVISLIATIGDNGEPLGIWCNGYGDASVAFELCKTTKNRADYHTGYLWQCCASKGASELICTLSNMRDYDYNYYEGNCYLPGEEDPIWYSYFYRACLSELNGVTAAFSWRYIQCGGYEMVYGCSNILVPSRRISSNETCMNSYYLPSASSTLRLQVYISYRSTIQSLMRIINTNYGCVQSGWSVAVNQISEILPDCNTTKYEGHSIDFGWGRVTIDEANYCEIS